MPHQGQRNNRQQGGQRRQSGRTASNPGELPIVRRCAEKVKQKAKKKVSKQQAMKMCVSRLQQAGIIAQNQQGQWVQRKRQASKGGR